MAICLSVTVDYFDQPKVLTNSLHLKKLIERRFVPELIMQIRL